MEFVLNILATTYFVVSFVLAIVVFFVGPAISEMLDAKHGEYTGVNAWVDFIFWAVDTCMMMFLIRMICRKYNIPDIMIGYFFGSLIFLVRNLIWNVVYSSKERFGVHFDSFNIIKWCLIGVGVFAIWHP